MQPQPMPNPQIEFINCGEEALLRARAIGQQIQERVWKAMAGHDQPGPHALDWFGRQEMNNDTESEKATGQDHNPPI